MSLIHNQFLHNQFSRSEVSHKLSDIFKIKTDAFYVWAIPTLILALKNPNTCFLHTYLYRRT